ncbi:MAG: alpha/beta fold hydrolase [Deltaproteobacteria bacterium]|nr:alpha/beta fold hydrolase [Deltaproteobacteria bacterium]
MPPKTKYAKSEGASIAYQVLGDGPFDLLLIPGFVSHVEAVWDFPGGRRFLNRLGSFSRLIQYDKRGTGLSDPVSEVPSTEQRVTDVQAVLDAAGSEKPAIMGVSEGGPLAIHFAAHHPERTRSLVLYGTAPRFAYAPDYEGGAPPEVFETMLHSIEEHWGEGVLLDVFAPSLAGDPAALELWGQFQRVAASPSMARKVTEALFKIDVRDLLPRIQAPTLVLHRADEIAVPVQSARYMAERIPGAKLVELPGADHMPFAGDVDALVGEIEEFLTGERHGDEAERVMATILFTDIVDSTLKARELGDHGWGELLERYHAVVRKELARFNGREMDTAGDGFFAAFDRPAKAIECARAVRQAVEKLGLRVRAGLHAGECEIVGKKLGGMAVHIAARVMSLAGPGEILVSETVKSLLLGSNLPFDDRGVHALKGIPAEWRLFSAGN